MARTDAQKDRERYVRSRIIYLNEIIAQIDSELRERGNSEKKVKRLRDRKKSVQENLNKLKSESSLLETNMSKLQAIAKASQKRLGETKPKFARHRKLSVLGSADDNDKIIKELGLDDDLKSELVDMSGGTDEGLNNILRTFRKIKNSLPKDSGMSNDDIFGDIDYLHSGVGVDWGGDWDSVDSKSDKYITNTMDLTPAKETKAAPAKTPKAAPATKMPTQRMQENFDRLAALKNKVTNPGMSASRKKHIQDGIFWAELDLLGDYQDLPEAQQKRLDITKVVPQENIDKILKADKDNEFAKYKAKIGYTPKKTAPKRSTKTVLNQFAKNEKEFYATLDKALSGDKDAMVLLAKNDFSMKDVLEDMDKGASREDIIKSVKKLYRSADQFDSEISGSNAVPVGKREMTLINKASEKLSGTKPKGASAKAPAKTASKNDSATPKGMNELLSRREALRGALKAHEAKGDEKSAKAMRRSIRAINEALKNFKGVDPNVKPTKDKPVPKTTVTPRKKDPAKSKAMNELLSKRESLRGAMKAHKAKGDEAKAESVRKRILKINKDLKENYADVDPNAHKMNTKPDPMKDANGKRYTKRGVTQMIKDLKEKNERGRKGSAAQKQREADIKRLTKILQSLGKKTGLAAVQASAAIRQIATAHLLN